MNGTVELNKTGEILFTPGANFSGEASFDYTVSDGNGASDTAVVGVTVNPVNNAPEAVDDSAPTDEDTPLTLSPEDLLANDRDIDNDRLSITEVNNAVNGTVEFNETGEIVFTPGADFNGEASFDYTVSDGNGGTDTATVNVNVNPVNDEPIPGEFSTTTNEDIPIGIAIRDLVGEATDVDFDRLSLTTFAGVPARPGERALIIPSNQPGVVHELSYVLEVVNEDTEPTLVFNPSPDFNGEASFDYTISDGNGGTAPGTVNITINPVNDAPVANDNNFTTEQDTAITISETDLLENDSDVDQDSLQIESVGSAEFGTVELNLDGSVVYTPGSDFNGEDSFEYTISDGNGGRDTATVRVTVDPVNRNPSAADDSAIALENSPLVIPGADLLSNDSDPDGNFLQITAVTPGINGTAELNENGNVIFTPGADFRGEANFVYAIDDGNGGTDTATVNVTVEAVNRAPGANDDRVSTDEDTLLTIEAMDLLVNDLDLDEDALTITEVSNAVNGTAQLDDDGNIVFTPGADFNGDASFEYTVNDGNGGTDIGFVNVTVEAVNDLPSAVDDMVSTDEDTPLTIPGDNLLVNDRDVDDDELNILAVSNGQNGTVELDNDGNVVYTPGSDFNGQDSFEYTISDGNGGIDVGSVDITVNPLNDLPAAQPDTATTSENTAITLSPGQLLANDIDVDQDPLTLVGAFNPVNGTIEPGVNNSIVFTPNTDFNGEAGFNYILSDGNGGTDIGTVDVTVTPGLSNSLSLTSQSLTVDAGPKVDILTGTPANDQFTFSDFPDVETRIIDFEVGRDQINLSELLDSFGYQATDPIVDGYIDFGATDLGTTIEIDPDGLNGNQTFQSLVTVENISLAALNNPNNFLV